MLAFAPGVDSRAAALDLVDHGVAVAPGTAFGTVAEDHARLSLASSEETIRGAVERIAHWAERTDRGAALMARR
jgi:aspartate/methionine/tyrosine aminotransferase